MLASGTQKHNIAERGETFAVSPRDAIGQERLTGNGRTYESNSFLFTIQRGRAVVAHRAHNPKVAGSNPAPATTKISNP